MAADPTADAPPSPQKSSLFLSRAGSRSRNSRDGLNHGHFSTRAHVRLRRRGALAGGGPVGGGAAGGKAFRKGRLRVIVPFAAGGAADLFGRALANGLSSELGQQVVVEVRAGAGGLTGVDALAKSTPDGHTICLAGAAALSAIPFMVTKMPFDWRKDLALLTLAVRVPEVLIVHPALGVDTLDDFVAYARAHPG